MRINITSQEQTQLRQYVLSLTGIDLDEGKSYLFEYRLSPLLQEYKLINYNELYYKSKENYEVREKLISAITTNETSFFRDQTPFDLLTQILPEKLKTKRSAGQRNPGLKIWSAACSFGQEVYSIAMLVQEKLNINASDVKILGTDISEEALAYASKGTYNKVELSRGLNMGRLSRFFLKKENHYQIADDIRAMTTFQKLNLMDALYGIGQFDVVLCRNVAVYFKQEDRETLFERLSKHLEPDGILIIGSTETLNSPSYHKHSQNGVTYYTAANPLTVRPRGIR